MTQDKSNNSKSTTSGRIGFFLIFIIIVGFIGIWIFQSRNGIATAQSQQTDSELQSKSVVVVVDNPQMRTFEKVIVTQGNVESKNIAMVSPRIPGVIEQFLVDEGDNVIAGQTQLFQTDSTKPQQNVTINEHALAVAVCVGQQAQANLEKAQADFEKAEIDFRRYERLLEIDATTQDTFEDMQLKYKQLAAVVKVCETQVALAEEQAGQAEAALAIAQKDLADTTVIAPINGTISMRMAEPGEMGSPGVPVLQIEDNNTIEVSAFLPANLYADVTAGQTIMQVTVGGTDIGNQMIYYKSPTIQPRLRTFEVKCMLENPPVDISPGAMAEVTIVLAAREAIGVPAASVLQRSGQSVIFVVENNVAEMKVVQTGFENNGWIEILEGDVAESESVVYMGQNMLDEGTQVSVQREAD